MELSLVEKEFSKTILRSISVMIEGMHGSRQRKAKKKAEENPNKENGEVLKVAESFLE